MNKNIFLLLVLSIALKTSSAQDSIIYINEDFTFKDGIYKSFKEFKANSPSLTKDVFITDERMITIDSNFDTDRVYYKDNACNRVKLSSDSIWGYSRNNIVYVYFNRNFYRLRILGAIGHFIITKNIHNTYQSTTYDSGSNKDIPYMLDFFTGKVYKYNLENFKLLLSTDQKLFYEFCALKSEHKMKKQMFIYLRKYNALHPIILRVNSNGKSELTIE